MDRFELSVLLAYLPLSKKFAGFIVHDLGPTKTPPSWETPPMRIKDKDAEPGDTTTLDIDKFTDLSVDEIVGQTTGDEDETDDADEVADDQESEDDDDLGDDDDSASEGQEEESEPRDDDDLSDSPNPDRFALDPKVAAQLPKDVVDRYNNHVAGIRKVEKQLGEQVETVQRLASWDAALNNPSVAPDALRKLGELIAKQHGFDLAEIFGSPKAATKPAETQTEEDEDPYVASQVEKLLAKKLGVDPAKLKTLLDEHDKSSAAKAFDAQVSEIVPKVIERLKDRDDGWTVTPEMVKEAIKALPQLRDRPVTAVRKWFSDERLAHFRSRVSAKRGPETPRSKGTKSERLFPDIKTASDAMKITASAILAADEDE